ncbi:hypothetical protein BGZ46_007151 [Entomortierella lignicola]|nr:hypothetical protein BGZ46_007151 [Entomortierella lignicola]
MKFAVSTIALVLSFGLLVSRVEASAIPTEVQAAEAKLVERTCLAICQAFCRNDTTGQVITLSGLPCKGCPTCPAGYTNVDFSVAHGGDDYIGKHPGATNVSILEIRKASLTACWRLALSAIVLVLSSGLLVSKIEASAIPTEVQANNANLAERTCFVICAVSCQNDTTGDIITVTGQPCQGCPTCPAGYTIVN